MAYNLRREYLLAHKDTVEKLIEAADKDLWLQVVCKDPGDAASTQHLFNNLLYSLSRWYPERAYVRMKIRTKMVWNEKGEHVVYVGVPPIGTTLHGPLPKTPAFAPAAIDADTTLVIEDAMDDVQAFTKAKLSIDVRIPTKTFHTIIFRKPPPPEGITWISDYLSKHGFEVKGIEPHFILMRKV